MSRVFVTLVRQTETPLLEVGLPVLPLARAAQACLHGPRRSGRQSRGRSWTPSSRPRLRRITGSHTNRDA